MAIAIVWMPKAHDVDDKDYCNTIPYTDKLTLSVVRISSSCSSCALRSYILYTFQHICLLCCRTRGCKLEQSAQPMILSNQQFTKSNLALVQNYETKLPICVIFVHSILRKSGHGHVRYTFDGLFIIKN